MNEVTTQHSAQKAVLVSGAAVAGLVPTTIEEVFRLAGAVHKAGLAPYGLETPEKLTIAIMTGLEVGLPPMQAVQSIAVINNRPTIWGDGLIAIVRKSPSCLFVREWIAGEGDAMVAHCETQRRGETETVRRSFSVDDASKARLWQTKERIQKKAKGGGTYEADNDSPWFRFPKRMLQMRARALCLRDVYADLLKGIQVREEVEDYPPRETRDITPTADTSPAMARLAAARAAQEPVALSPITEHVEAEIAALGDRGRDDAAFDDGADSGGDTISDEAIEGLAAALSEFSGALFRADTMRALRAHAAAFWNDRDDCPDEGTAGREIVDRVFNQHAARVDGTSSADKCRAAVDQIIREVA